MGMRVTRSGSNTTNFINVNRLITQLFNAKVILNRLPQQAQNLDKIKSDIIRQNNANTYDDEFFFKDFEKKHASKTSKPYCSKCDETIEDSKTNQRSCPKCDTPLLYKCMSCNRQYSHYDAYSRHLRNSCKPESINSKSKFSSCENNNKTRNNNVPSKDEIVPNTENTLFYTFPNKNYTPPQWGKYCPKCKKVLDQELIKLRKKCYTCESIVLYQCMKCNKQFQHVRNLQYHAEGICSPRAHYICSKCGYKTSIKETIRRHVKQPHLKQENQKGKNQKLISLVKRSCQDCDIAQNNKKPINNEKSMKSEVHCNQCKKKLSYQCAVCDKYYNHHPSLQYHIKTSHSFTTELIKCMKCDGSYSKQTIRKHEKLCGAEANLTCDFCPYKTKYSRSLQNHLQAHLGQIKNMMKSRVGRVLSVKSNLGHSKKIRVGKKLELLKKFQRYCKTCNETTANSAFKNNINCSKCQTKFLLQCIGCLKMYEYYSSIQYHIKVMCKSKITKGPSLCSKTPKETKILKKKLEHVCELCPYETDYKNDFIEHLNIHSAKGDFSKRNENERLMNLYKRYCSKCDLAFVNQAKNNEPNCKVCETKFVMQCLKCNKQFPDYTSIKYHIRYHCDVQIDPVKCPNCNKNYQNSIIMKRHLKTCAMEALYTCDICPYKSKFKKALGNHLRKHLEHNIAKCKNIKKGIEAQKGILDLCIRYCSKCDETVANCKFKNQPNCGKCNTALQMECLKCKKRCKHYAAMAYHLKKFCYGKNIQCSKCDFTTTGERTLKLHILRLHTNIDPDKFVKCPKCEKPFKLPLNLQIHQRYCQVEPKFFCDICPYKTKYKTSMAKHQQRHLLGKNVRTNAAKYYDTKPKIKRLQCSECDHTTHDETLLRRHVLRVHRLIDPESSAECYKCGGIYKNLDSLLAHEKYCQAEPKFFCDVCPYKTKHKTSMIKHQECHLLGKNVRPNGSKNYQNNVKTEILQCSECDHTTHSETLLRRHVLRVHRLLDSESSAECYKCGGIYKSLDSLLAHEKYCQTEPKFFCDLCPYKTKYKQSLVYHLKCHSEGAGGTISMKGFCPKCKKSRYLMKRRSRCCSCRTLLVLNCSKCKKQFPNLATLRIHVKSHSETQYRCSFCDRVFMQSNNLKMHEKMCQEQPSLHRPVHDSSPGSKH